MSIAIFRLSNISVVIFVRHSLKLHRENFRLNWLGITFAVPVMAARKKPPKHAMFSPSVSVFQHWVYQCWSIGIGASSYKVLLEVMHCNTYTSTVIKFRFVRHHFNSAYFAAPPFLKKCRTSQVIAVKNVNYQVLIAAYCWKHLISHMVLP